MLTKTRLDFILQLTNYFHGHWEDPAWGHLATSQVLIAIAVKDLASGIQDVETRNAIQGAAEKAIAKGSQAVGRG